MRAFKNEQANVKCDGDGERTIPSKTKGILPVHNGRSRNSNNTEWFKVDIVNERDNIEEEDNRDNRDNRTSAKVVE